MFISVSFFVSFFSWIFFRVLIGCSRPIVSFRLLVEISSSSLFRVKVSSLFFRLIKFPIFVWYCRIPSKARTFPLNSTSFLFTSCYLFVFCFSGKFNILSSGGTIVIDDTVSIMQPFLSRLFLPLRSDVCSFLRLFLFLHYDVYFRPTRLMFFLGLQILVRLVFSLFGCWWRFCIEAFFTTFVAICL